MLHPYQLAIEMSVLVATDLWFRNPVTYIRELVECGQTQVIWDRGVLAKKKIDPIKHAELYFGKQYNWRIMLCGEQGASEYRPGDKLSSPTAVYPVWEYGDSATLLEEIMEYPVGEDHDICDDQSVPKDERPVLGQEHRVVVIGMPPLTSGVGRNFFAYLSALQDAYPDCIVHLHNPYSFRYMFSGGVRATDYEPRNLAGNKKIVIPAGKEIPITQALKYQHWIKVLGFKIPDLDVPRNRCMYNIKSAVWASQYFDEEVNFSSKKSNEHKVDTLAPQKDFKPVSDTRPFTRNGVDKIQKNGDKFACNSCSLQLHCKHFRLGAVCSVPGAEPKKLAEYFGSRDSSKIVEGLGLLMSTNANRLQQGMNTEAMVGDVDPEVTKLVNQLFTQGVQLAKLLDPSLRGGAKVQVNVGGNGQAAIATGSPQQMMSIIVRSLEENGIPRDQITSDMVKGVLTRMADGTDQQRAIEGEVIAIKDA